MRIVFMGTPQAAVPALETLLNGAHDVVAVYSQPDRPSGRGNKIVYSPVKQFALEHQIDVFQPAKVKTFEAFENFRSHKADVAVVVAYGRILPEAFLTSFPLGAINVHFSLLPKYRGAAPVNWALANGDTIAGVTIMKMDSGLDTGDILLQSELRIGDEEIAPKLTARLANLGAGLLQQALETIDRIEPRKQDNAAATFAPILRRVEGTINWERTAIEINNRIRGFQPFPGSFTDYNGKQVTIWRAVAVRDDPGDSQVPGTVLGIENGTLSIACGMGSVLKIDEVQMEGKRRMSAADFINGSRIQIGEQFGRTKS